MSGGGSKSKIQWLRQFDHAQGRDLLSGLRNRRLPARASEHLVKHNSDTIYKDAATLVGLDRSAAQAAFSEFLNDRSLSPQQIRFVEMVIDQLTVRRVVAVDTAVI